MQQRELVATALLMLASILQARGSDAPALYVFGDSTVDVGNNDYIETVLKANFPPYGRDFDTKRATGRFSNGRLAVDYLASHLGLPFPPAYLSPDARTTKIIKGVNFASAGSGIYSETGRTLNLAGLDTQLTWFRASKEELIKFVGQAEAASIISNAFFLLSSGSNDYVNGYYFNPLLQAKYSKLEYAQLLVNNTANFLKELYQLGARRITVVSLSPLGCLPSQVTIYGHGQLHCIDFISTDARNFNTALIASLQSLKSARNHLRLAYVDLYTPLSDIFEQPAKYGFEQTLTACCGDGRLATSILCNEFTPGTCSDSSKYAFWDSFHPSDTLNKILAKETYTQAYPQIFQKTVLR